jgi:succinate dehydrogenase/fumarate reductase cytochrome b subunit
MSQGLTLPRNTTRQAEKPLHGNIARWLHRITGTVIVAFVLVHVVAQTILHVPGFASIKAGMPWLPAAQSQHWVHALLYFSIVFHTLYGLKLLVTELGWRMEYRTTLWSIVTLSALVGLREVLRYAGI